MCGIAGIFDISSKPIERSMLEKIKRVLQHRGPDDSGCTIIKNVGFVHTRLSILDLSDAAHQPMWDETRQYCITYNGEIYNFKDIRKDLEGQGITFSSTGDTEVLLKACLTYGVKETLPKLNGMFAFALWDNDKKELWLARDRMGIKPLYITQYRNLIVFASEIKAIIEIIGTPDIDLSSLYLLLVGGTAWEPHTLFSNIEALNPGHYLCITDKKIISQTPFYDLFNDVDKDLFSHYDKMSSVQVVKHFSELMDKSVDIHSVSDAPVAVLASGGIDSSLIAALSKPYCPGISMYHSDIVGKESELEYARQLSNYLKRSLVVSSMKGKDYIESLVETTYYHETASCYIPNDVPFQLVARKAKEDGIKVLLTGEGADELFIGYGEMSKRILKSKFTKLFRINFPFVKDILVNIMKILVRSDGPSPIEIIASRGRNVNLLNKAKEAFSFINDDTERDALVNSALYLKVHLGSVLQRNDRMGMMHSIESRIPFLENNVVKFALNLPIKYKHPNTISGLIFGHPLEKNKRIVREIAEGLIPDSIIKRKKMGFPVSPDEYVSYKSDFFIDGFLERSLGFKHEEFKMFFNSIDIELKWNFFATEIFGKLFFLNIPHDVVTEKIKTYTNNICSI